MELEGWHVAVALAAVVCVWALLAARRRLSTRSLVEGVKQVYVPRHEYRAVDPGEFTHLDLEFYDESRRELESCGFRFLQDEEDVTVKGNFPDPRTFIRVMLGEDDTVMAGIYQPKPALLVRVVLRLMGARIGRTVDFETEFTGGSFVCTSNAEIAGAIGSPPQVEVEYLKLETPIVDILARHKQRVRTYLAGHDSTEPLVLYTREDVHASQHRLEALKAEYRKSVGWVAREELEKCASGNVDLAASIHEEVKAINEEEDEE